MTKERKHTVIFAAILVIAVTVVCILLNIHFN